MSRIRITPLAGQDLVEIWYFIAQDDPVAADRLLDLLEEKVQTPRRQSAYRTGAAGYSEGVEVSPSGQLFASLSNNFRRN
jgi:plasmid stabilization system protein ParE